MKAKQVVNMALRDRILEAAAELFYSEGVRGVGMDLIAARAQTTKMGIYRHFESKDVLVMEWLSGVSQRKLSVFDVLAAQYPDEPLQQLKAWVKLVVDGFYAISHRGCQFANSIAELPDRNHPARKVIERHKAKLADIVADLCRRSGISDAEMASAHLIFLLEGAQVSVQNMGISSIEEKVLLLSMQIIEIRSS